MSQLNVHPNALAVARFGWLRAHKWLLLRRCSQVSILALFLAGPVLDIWLVKGNLSASLTFGVLPLTDPYMAIQSLLSGHPLRQTAVIGAIIVLVFYLIVGGRVYCSWVCPLNIVTDLAAWLRRLLGIKNSNRMSHQVRYWLLAITLLVPTVSGLIVWEMISPVSLLHRSLIFGFGLSGIAILGIFFYDLLLSDRGWCGRLCPVGAFYSLIRQFSLLRVAAPLRSKCDSCLDCIQVCPEPRIIMPVVKPKSAGTSMLIKAPECTNCGRCIDVCHESVFQFKFPLAANVSRDASISKESMQ